MPRGPGRIGEARPAKEAPARAPSRTPASERVMVAGVDLFAEFGFLATTIRDITGACGVTAAAFYNHFESKEMLLYAIVTEANTRLELRLDELGDREDASETLAALVHTLVTFNLESPKEARVANREYTFLHPVHRDEVVAHRRRVRSMFERTLAERQAGGLLVNGATSGAHSETRLLAISVINLSIASSEWYRAAGPLSIAEVADCHCRLALRMAGLASTAIPARNSPSPMSTGTVIKPSSPVPPNPTSPASKPSNASGAEPNG